MFRTEMLKARRNGHWFRLSRMERGFFSLATKIKVAYKSYALIRAMVAILRKLKVSGSRAYRRLVHGVQLAWSFSEAAVLWGNKEARFWRNDRSYILFLGNFLPGVPSG